MNKTIRILNADFIGAMSSGLCLMHCLATPFLFIAKACTATCCADTPSWWQLIDYLFYCNILCGKKVNEKISEYWFVGLMDDFMLRYP